MKNLFLTLVSILFLFCTCKNEPKAPSTLPAAEPLQITSTEFSKTEGDCTKSCGKFSVRHPRVSGNDAVDAALLKWTETFANGFVNMEQPAGTSQALDSSANQFVVAYKAALKDGMAEHGFVVEVKDSVLLNNGKCLTIVENGYYDYGGAHPNYTSQILSLDPATAKSWSADDLVADKEGILKLLSEEYRKVKKEAFDNGFEFEGGKITFPQNVGVLANGLLFHYNTYEIASHAMGDADIVLTWEQLGAMAKAGSWR